ncbi:contact-dependent growth inhibition system immunity protein [Halostreptopolyspora alba]|uniref:CdiI immunity protein domain-containing protein n=1 Tax=Halostreptopolyspora alba TaxID=2487137 RepID=A0A3N0DQS6_9ACTN|nr:hypothetical protein EFW17_23595 [Nocardiopsaceae bacterium YIM 96095]
MYDYLREFMTSAFHQDWKLDAPDERSSVRHYVSTNPRTRSMEVLAEIDDLLAADLSEKRLEKYIIRDLGANVVPPKGPNRWSTWLRAIRDDLESGITGD